MIYIIEKYKCLNDKGESRRLYKLNNGSYIGGYNGINTIIGTLVPHGVKEHTLEWWKVNTTTNDKEGSIAHRISSGKLKPFWTGYDSPIVGHAYDVIDRLME